MAEEYEGVVIYACDYCTANKPGILAKEKRICSPSDPRAPYWGKIIADGTEMKLRGCASFDHNGERIPDFHMRFVPSDSVLQTMPLEKIVHAISGQRDVSGNLTARQILRFE